MNSGAKQKSNRQKKVCYICRQRPSTMTLTLSRDVVIKTKVGRKPGQTEESRFYNVDVRACKTCYSAINSVLKELGYFDD